MKPQTPVMKHIAALIGVLALSAHIIPAYSENSSDVFDEDGLTAFEQINQGHPDYKAKLLACQFMGEMTASLTKRIDEDGSARKTIFFTNKAYKIAEKSIIKFLGKDLKKTAYDPRVKQWALKVGMTAAADGPLLLRERAYNACGSAIEEVTEGFIRQKKKNPSTSTDIHNECLDAKDYEGCMKYRSGQSQKNTDNECLPNKPCIAGKGSDMLGMPMITGWRMVSLPADQTVAYARPSMQKVNVRGKTNRYISQEVIIRSYESPQAGIPGSTTTIGSKSTNCIGYGSSITCTTKPATTFSTPGRAARPGGIAQTTVNLIFDCQERTYGEHIDGELRGKWKSIDGTRHESSVNKNCPIINSLELSTFTNYAND